MLHKIKMPSRVHLTFVQKIKIIEKSGLPGFDRNKISEKYGVSKPTIVSILKNKKITSRIWNFMP